MTSYQIIPASCSVVASKLIPNIAWNNTKLSCSLIWQDVIGKIRCFGYGSVSVYSKTCYELFRVVALGSVSTICFLLYSHYLCHVNRNLVTSWQRKCMRAIHTHKKRYEYCRMINWRIKYQVRVAFAECNTQSCGKGQVLSHMTFSQYPRLHNAVFRTTSQVKTTFRKFTAHPSPTLWPIKTEHDNIIAQVHYNVCRIV